MRIDLRPSHYSHSTRSIDQSLAPRPLLAPRAHAVARARRQVQLVLLRAVHALLCVLPDAAAAALCASAPRVPPRPDGFQLGQLTPQALAYVGDAVFELHARDALLWPPRRMNAYSSEVLELARAEGQFELLQRLEAEFALTDDEREWMRRGRNAAREGDFR